MQRKLTSGLLAVMLVAAVVIAVPRFFSAEGTWLCENGEWVKHGRPAGPAPDEPCPPAEPVANGDPYADLIRVFSPAPGEIIASPLAVRGEARGYWFFEASFPVRLIDAEERVLIEYYATAEGEWMTEDFVSFSAELEFARPETADGVLILMKDNPSGLPEFDDEIRIPVRFADED